MTNFEKYRDKIESIMSESGSMAPAVKNGVPVMCDFMIDCNFCDYDRSDGNCWIAFIEWACKDANESKKACPTLDAVYEALARYEKAEELIN